MCVPMMVWWLKFCIYLQLCFWVNALGTCCHTLTLSVTFLNYFHTWLLCAKLSIQKRKSSAPSYKYKRMNGNEKTANICQTQFFIFQQVVILMSLAARAENKKNSNWTFEWNFAETKKFKTKKKMLYFYWHLNFSVIFQNFLLLNNVFFLFHRNNCK